MSKQISLDYKALRALPVEEFFMLLVEYEQIMEHHGRGSKPTT